MLDTDLAWAAGFIDGDGCFHAAPLLYGHHLTLTVTQVDPRPLFRLQKVLGCGNICRQTRGPYVFSLGARPLVFSVIRQLYPHLCKPKQEQIRRCLGRIRNGYTEKDQDK